MIPLGYGLRSTVGSGSRDGPVLQIACTMIIYPEALPGPTCALLTRRASIGMASIWVEGVVYVRVVRLWFSASVSLWQHYMLHPKCCKMSFKCVNSTNSSQMFVFPTSVLIGAEHCNLTIRWSRIRSCPISVFVLSPPLYWSCVCVRPVFVFVLCLRLKRLGEMEISGTSPPFHDFFIPSGVQLCTRVRRRHRK